MHRFKRKIRSRAASSDAINSTQTRPRRGPIARFLRGWVAPVVIVLALQTPLRASLLDWNSVPSGSMRPTILEGERILVNKLAFGLRVPLTHTWLATWGEPERGDIITFASPKDGSRLVKRVVGLPGDVIEMRGNMLIVNGETIEYDLGGDRILAPGADGSMMPMRLGVEHLPGREHGIALTPSAGAPNSFTEVVVPEGQYFVMGDNRDQSFDSRYFGFVERSDIYGRSSYVVTSLDPRKGGKPRFDRWFTRLP
jgi:signal peptidase I